jgi:hypothetical protein
MPQFLNRARGWLGRLRPQAGKPEARAGLPRDWVNIAVGKRCEQSSLSDYSRPHEAHAGANGHIARDYAFHTDNEARPWWRIDLGMRYPLQAIIVHNRRAAAWQFRSRSLRIEASANGKSWFLLHQGLSYFGTGPEGRPFVLELGGQVLARHVRLSLDDHRPLHLAEVEVYTSTMETALRDWLRARGLGPQGLYFGSRPDFHKPRYWFTGEGAVSAVQVREFGRFANILLQVTNAVAFARRIGVRRVYLPDFANLTGTDPIVIDGITLLPKGQARPETRILVGDFFRLSAFDKALAHAADAARAQIVRDHIRRRLDLFPLPEAARLDDRTVVFHFRSGDVFRPRPHSFYVQPPAAYYIAILERLVAEGRIERAILVAEDRNNPAIAALEARLAALGIGFRFQSGSFREDVQTLIGARHLVFGFGTFGVGICLLADSIDSVHYFGPADALQPYDTIPGIGALTRVSAEDYIAFGDWRATPAQLELMTGYEASGLRFEQVRGPA